MVGTLDYLAPEQIRGERCRRTHRQYALACVLYECLTGLPPFHRETEGETLWAHMQERSAPLREHPGSTPCSRRGLAKERDERYADLCRTDRRATRALGLAPAPPRRRRVRTALMRHRRAILAAGALGAPAAVAAATAVLMTGGGAGAAGRERVAAIGIKAGRVDSFVQARTAPSNIAVGDGRGLGPQHRGQDDLSHRPEDQAGRQDVRDPSPADRRRCRSRSDLGRKRQQAHEGPGTRLAHRSRHRPGHPHRPVPHTPDRGGWESSGHR